MSKTHILWILVGLLALSACHNCKTHEYDHERGQASNDKLLVATLYHQKSAERDALCLQAYNIARHRLDEIIAQNPDASNLAIVLDLDETVLDNSPYEAMCVLDNTSYPVGWDEWMYAADAKALPGAVDFLKYAKSKNINIFYITNRKEKYREATLQNLQKHDLASATKNHLLLRTNESSKEPRRQQVLEKHEIVMLFGDNLADFSKVFDGEKNTSERAILVDSLKNEFGNRFIVFPNVMYGDWLNAVIDYNFGLSPAEKIQREKEGLVGPKCQAQKPSPDK